MTKLCMSDLNKVCRGCLCKNGEMRPLFGSFLDNMLRIVANIEVQMNDGLPQLMCVPCVLQVSRAFTFKQQCQRSDTTLRTVFQEMEKTSTNAEHVMIDLNVVKAIELLPKEALQPVGRGGVEETVVVHRETVHLEMQQQQQMQHKRDSQDKEEEKEGEEEEEDEPFNGAPSIDDVNLDKCLLIVQSDEIEEALCMATSNDDPERSSASAYIIDATGEGLDDHHDDGVDIVLDDLHDETLKPGVLRTIKLDDVIIEENDLDGDIMNDHFDAYSTKDDMDSPSIISIDDNILNILPTQHDSKTTCVDCNVLFDTKENLKVHRQMRHNSFKCHVCDKVFAENKILKRHLKIHNPNKPHSCHICLMKFAESSNLTKHMKKHTGELRAVVGKPNLCSVCGKGFKWASSLSKHMKHHTKHKILNCPYCPKYYVEMRSLNIHIRSHTGEKPFVCEVCNKGFTQLGNLEKHLRVHTGERPYECPICRKGFSQSGYVAIHLRTHTGERPYVCTECGKGFASSNTLAIHKRTHTGERPYSCSICKKTFARHETVIIHQRTHTGEKPHICTICSRGFASSGHLTGHMRSHAGVKTHECTICGKRLAGSSSLKVHMKTHEKNEDARTSTFDIDLDEKTVLSTIYECNVCNQQVTDTSYDHQIVDGVLICSNLNSLMATEAGGSSDLGDEIRDSDGTSLLLADDSNQQVIISLSGLKEEIF